MVSLPRHFIKQCEIRSRLLAPNWVRKAYRMAKGFGSPEESKPLPEALVHDCRFFANRNVMLDALPRQAVVVELGTLRGEFAREILQRTDPKILHIVDIDFAIFDATLESDARVRCHRGFTHEVMDGFSDASVDWVYVDADHSYAATLRDAEVASKKIRPGGYLVFNDFAHVDPTMGRYGVHRAVVDFAVATGWPFRMFAYQPNALYDVALQKPAVDRPRRVSAAGDSPASAPHDPSAPRPSR